MFNSGVFYIFSSVLLTVVSQLIIKWRVSFFSFDSSGLYNKFRVFIYFLFDPLVIFAFFCLFISCFFWVLSMTKFQLTTVYPLITISLLFFTTVSSVLLFGESFNGMKFFGLLISLCGILIIYFSEI